jgi:hypothetical protein
MTLEDIRNHLSQKYGNTHHFLGSVELQNLLIIRNPKTHRAITVVRKHGEIRISRGGLSEPEALIDATQIKSLQQIEAWLD